MADMKLLLLVLASLPQPHHRASGALCHHPNAEDNRGASCAAGRVVVAGVGRGARFHIGPGLAPSRMISLAGATLPPGSSSLASTPLVSARPLAERPPFPKQRRLRTTAGGSDPMQSRHSGPDAIRCRGAGRGRQILTPPPNLGGVEHRSRSGGAPGVLSLSWVRRPCSRGHIAGAGATGVG